MKKAIVTGLLGQDASYLTDYLLELGYEVYGIYRRVSTGNVFDNIADAYGHHNLNMVCGDITDHGFMRNLIMEVRPDEIFNLAAMSHVGQSFAEPIATFRVDAEAVINMLDAVKDIDPKIKFYQASTSELYGGLNCPEEGYCETHSFHPRSPYAVAKLAAYYSVVNYREAYGLFAVNGILFNHESPRRGLDFAPRKITNGVAAIKLGKQEFLHMGNLEAYRDIGHAQDYVKGMYMMLQQKCPDDYVLATGTSISIRQMLEYVCELAELNFKDVYRINEKFMRPSEVPFLKGNSAKIRAIGWKPEYDWKALLKEMYENDLRLLRSNGGKE